MYVQQLSEVKEWVKMLTRKLSATVDKHTQKKQYNTPDCWAQLIVGAESFKDDVILGQPLPRKRAGYT